jgi:hypothetical protein
VSGKQDVSHAGHDDSRASEAAAPLVRQIEDMLADTSAGTNSNALAYLTYVVACTDVPAL